MPPTIAFAEPDEVLAAVQPFESLGGLANALTLRNVDPGVVMIPKDFFSSSRLRVGRKDDRIVLPPVQLADDEASITRPIHPEKIVLPRIARNVDPDRRATRG